jgi:hypothetical protein
VKPSDPKLDQTILSVSLASWQKVAMILGKSFRQLEDEGIQISFEDLAARIEALVSIGRLESQGDLSQWRHSEVRTPAATPVTPSPRPSRREGKGEGGANLAREGET